MRSSPQDHRGQQRRPARRDPDADTDTRRRSGASRDRGRSSRDGDGGGRTSRDSTSSGGGSSRRTRTSRDTSPSRSSSERRPPRTGTRTGLRSSTRLQPLQPQPQPARIAAPAPTPAPLPAPAPAPAPTPAPAALQTLTPSPTRDNNNDTPTAPSSSGTHAQPRSSDPSTDDGNVHPKPHAQPAAATPPANVRVGVMSSATVGATASAGSAKHADSKASVNADAGAGEEHPLMTPWTLYAHRNDESGWDFPAHFLRVIGFDTIETFWVPFRLLSQWSTRNTYFLMRRDYEPRWEDPVNGPGGWWSLQVDPLRGKALWQDVVLYMVGETLFDHLGTAEGDRLMEGVTGGTLAINKHLATIKIWHRAARMPESHLPPFLITTYRPKVKFIPRPPQFATGAPHTSTTPHAAPPTRATRVCKPAPVPAPAPAPAPSALAMAASAAEQRPEGASKPQPPAASTLVVAEYVSSQTTIDLTTRRQECTTTYECVVSFAS